MRILRSADYRRMPWKKGGGETREVAVWPRGATLDTLDWRLSLATVTSDGPFSIFDGIVRTLCVVRGVGVRLQVGDAPERTLFENSDPYTFDGGTPTSASLIDGTIIDLNVMSRRGRFRHTVKRAVFANSLQLQSCAHSIIVFCQRGSLRCTSGGDTSDCLAAEDCAIMDDVPLIHLFAEETAAIQLIELYLDSPSHSCDSSCPTLSDLLHPAESPDERP